MVNSNSSGQVVMQTEHLTSPNATLMKAGTNKLTLTIQAGPINNGDMYDYIRLELAE